MNLKEAKNNIISLKRNAFSSLLICFFLNIFLVLVIIYFVNVNVQIFQSSVIQNITVMHSMNYFLNNLTNEQRSICLLIFISFFILAIALLFVSIRTIWLSSRVEESFELSKKDNLFIYSIISFIFPIIIFQIILFIKSSKVKRDIFTYFEKNETKNIEAPVVTLDNIENNIVNSLDDKKINLKINLDEINESSDSFNINSLRKKLLTLKEMVDNGEISYKEYLQLKTKAINSI